MAKYNLREEIAKRKYHITPRPYYWFYRTVMKVVGRKYNAHFKVIDDVNKEKGPVFVIFNHLSRIDHFYVNEICYPKRVNMIAGYSEFFRSHLHWAFKMNNVLPKKQYTNDLISTKAIMSIIKQGGSVTFAPGGLATNDGMSRPIVPGTGHLFKKFKIPVYHVKLEGQYLQNNKVCLDERYGETYATIYKLFTPEDLETLSVEEIENKINLAFKHDEYLWQHDRKIKWKIGEHELTYNLGDLLFECPKCHKLFTMKDKDNTLYCTKCGNGVVVDEYYEMHALNNDSVFPKLTSDWVNQERVNVIKTIRKDSNFSFSVNVRLGLLPNDHLVKNHKMSEIVSDGVFTVDHNGVHYKDNNDDKHSFDMDYKQIYTLITELDTSCFEFYHNGEFTELFPENRNTTLYINMLVEEMHRLHVNYFKNLPWNDWMYKENN